MKEPDEATEEWRTIARFVGYEISNLGRVRSLLRPGPRLAAKLRAEPRILSQTRNPDTGYMMVSLGRANKCYVHRLVCEAFHGAPPPNAETAHGDGVQTNNRAGNLSWKTRVENNRDKARHGTKALGEKVNRAVLTEVDVRAIRAVDPAVLNLHHLARRFGVSAATIHRVVHRQTWRHVA